MPFALYREVDNPSGATSTGVDGGLCVQSEDETVIFHVSFLYCICGLGEPRGDGDNAALVRRANADQLIMQGFGGLIEVCAGT